MNVNERILLGAVALSLAVITLVGVFTSGVREASVALLFGAFVALVIFAEKIYVWCDVNAQKSTNFGWYVLWEVVSMPFAVACVCIHGIVPERH